MYVVIKFTILISLIIALFSGKLRSQNACPINFDGEKFKLVEHEPQKYVGKIVAFNATVLQVEKGLVDKPYYKVELEKGGELWIASTIISGYEVVGRNVRIMGYFANVIDDDDLAKKFNKSKYQVIALAIIDLKTKQASMLPSANSQFKEWANGFIPNEGSSK